MQIQDSIESSSNRLMWINADRVFYAGLLGSPSVRTLGSLTLYVSLGGPIRISVDGAQWQTTDLAVVPPYVPHRIACDARLICCLLIEPETVDLERLPASIKGGSGAVDAPAFVERVQAAHARLRRAGREVDLQALSFDQCFFGQELAPRRIDSRILTVLNRIKRDPATQTLAEDCAESAHLSFSRFLHLFKAEVSTPFRSFRTWQRARSLLHYVTKESNLAHVALDVGYPDSTHFSHSIRQVYGLKPKDIFAGSRKLALYARSPVAEAGSSLYS